MPPNKRVKEVGRERLRLVGVIRTTAELRLAVRMPAPPDLFEVRLDWLATKPIRESKFRELPAPLIITARHPAEGGKHHLSSVARRDLLLRYLPLARYVDVELRSVATSRRILESARRLNVGVIVSFHDFKTTPALGSLRAKAAQAARVRPAIFKVATRTDTAVQLSRLVQFLSKKPRTLPVAAMGLGRLGAISRFVLAECGSALIYTSLSKSDIEGQLSLNEFRAGLGKITSSE